MSFDASHDRASNHDAIRYLSDFGHLFRPAYAEADGQRQIR